MSEKTLSILMFFAMLFWGLTWINAKVLSNYLDAYNLIFWRFLISAITTVPVVLYFRQSFKIDYKNLLLSFVGALFLTLYNYLFFEGTKYGDAGFGGILVTTLNPILTFFTVALITLKKLTKRELLALFLGAVGTMSMLKIWEYGLDIWFKDGIKYFLLASLTWVFITLTSARVKNFSAIVFSFYMFAFSTLLDFIFLLHGTVAPIGGFDTLFWLNLIAISLFGVTFATTIYFLASSKMGSKWASSYIFLVPFSAAIFAALFLGEKLELTTVIGGFLVIVAIYIINGQMPRFLKRIVRF